MKTVRLSTKEIAILAHLLEVASGDWFTDEVLPEGYTKVDQVNKDVVKLCDKLGLNPAPDGLCEIPPPIGNYVLAHKTKRFVDLLDGRYYHYSDVVNMLKHYEGDNS